MVVPRLPLPGYLSRLNIAGWADTTGGTYVCKTCKKQLNLSLSELRIFFLIKPDTDLFRFAYEVPPHKLGGTFSTEMCKESQTKVLRDYERPTYIMSTNEEQPPTAPQGGNEVHGESGRPVSDTMSHQREEEEVHAQEVKKKVEALSPQMAEERYNYLLSKSLSELTDAEYEERLALAEKLSDKPKKKPEKR